MKKILTIFLTVMFVMVGLVSAVHTSDVVISSDGWLEASTFTDFTVSVSNAGSSSDSIKRVVINLPITYTGLLCGTAPSGWVLTSDTYSCRYDGGPIVVSSSKNFTLSVTTGSNLSGAWTIATKDQADDTDSNTVAPRGQTIQGAIDAWETGDGAIEVPAGTYTENVNIGKSLTIKGASGSIVIVNALSSSGSVFTVTANSVSISGFTITGASDGGQAGIYLGAGVANCNIFDNILTGNYDGIWLGSGSNHNTLTDNTLSSNYQGFEVYISSDNTFTNNIANSNANYGFKIDSGNNNVFTNNIANSNGKWGFYTVTGDGGGTTNSIFTNNIANLNTQYGMRMNGGSGNTLTGNTFDSNLIAGIRLKEEITNLILDNNNFTNSQKGIDIDSDTVITNVTSWTVIRNKLVGNTLNVYNDGIGMLIAENNWWSTANKDAIDALIDGNVDFTPWWFDSTGSSTDTTAPTVTFSDTPYGNEVNTLTTINITISDDSGIANYSIDWGDGTIEPRDADEETSITNISTHTYSETLESGKYIVTVTATDVFNNEVIVTVGVSIYEATDWEISLQKGIANFIAIPFVPKSTTSYDGTHYKNVLEVIRPNLDRIWSYENGEWIYRKTTETGAWSTLGTLQEVIPGRGYIVFMKNDDVLYGYKRTISGEPGDTPVTPASVNLVSGWNIIGKFGENTLKKSESLNNLLFRQSMLLGNLADYPITNLNEVFLSNDDNLEPEKGYWTFIGGSDNLIEYTKSELD